MDEGLLPPFGQPAGPAVDDSELLSSYARGEPVGHSPRFHVEGPTLLASPDVAVAMRIGPSAVLVRTDLPGSVADAKPEVEQALASHGMTLLDAETPLGVAIAMQALGLRISSWDLWGTDIDEAFAALRRSAVGEDTPPAFVEAEPPTPL